MKAEGTAPSGIMLVDKPSGITSHDVIYAVRRAFGTKQAGHTGTLDPLATGLLAVMVGRAVKASPYLTAGRKEYSAGIRFGVETDTEDITGNVISEKNVSFTAEEVKTACDALTGQIEQIPPMYSAKKVGGKKLYELARQGLTVSRTAQKVTVYSIDLDPCPYPSRDFTFRVSCSSGTYIRTLCADMGRMLGCGAVMTSLRRLSAGSLSLDGAVGLDELKNMSREEAEGRLIPVDKALLDAAAGKVNVTPFHERLIRSGCAVLLRKITSATFPDGSYILICGDNGFFSLGETVSTGEGPALKSRVLFEL